MAKPRPGRHRSARPAPPLPPVTTVPVLAVLVCHNGERWLPDTMAALRDSTQRPRFRLAVDTGSTDGTAELLAAAVAAGQLDGVLTLPVGTGFGDAVRTAVATAEQRWGDPGRWLWLLHDDSAPEPDCLAAMLVAADASPSVAVLGPLNVDWSDPRLVVEAGLSTDASGHRQLGVGTGELDPGLFGDLAQSTEVLAVSSAGALIRQDVWRAVGGYDPALPLLRDDIDFGWRVNRVGHLVLVVPTARLRHAGAGRTGERDTPALDLPPRAADRAHGLRTFLVNCPAPSFLLGVPRLILLCLLRSLGLLLLRRPAAAGAELRAVRYVVSGRAGLRAARRSRRDAGAGSGGSVRGLLVSRPKRLRNAVRGGLVALLRRRMIADAVLGRLPDRSISWVAAAAKPVDRPIGPRALPAGALRGLRRPGQRRAGGGIAVTVPGPRTALPAPAAVDRPDRPSPRLRPSPFPRGTGAGSAARPVPELLFVEVSHGRLVRELLLAPPVVLIAGLVLATLAVHQSWLGLDLTGGRLAPLPDLAAVWSAYLAEWHPVAGGTAAPAPATLAVVGVLGALLYPVGGPAAAASALLIAGMPLAGLSAYLASRRVRVSRWGRAAAAAAYALLPVGIQSTADGRLDGVLVHILLPIVLSGVVGVLSGRTVGRGGRRGWLPSASGTALGLAAISAFAPLLHLIVLAVVLVGFVLVAGPHGHALRRMVALFVVVMLPLGLLLPWPAVVLQHPEVLVHGTGAVTAEPQVSVQRLAMLDAGGAGSVGWLGALVLVGALIAVLARPRLAAVPGLAVALIGMAAAVVVNTTAVVPLAGGEARPGWPGPALLVVACGALWAALAALAADQPAEGVGQPGRAGWRPALLPAGAVRALTPVLAGAAVAALALGALLGTGGAVGTVRPRLAEPIQAEVTADRTAVLVVSGRGEPVRMAVGGLPGFGDDDLAPVATAPARLARWADAFDSDRDEAVRSAVLEAAVSGVEFVVLPDQAAADALLTGADDLVIGAPDTSDGRPTVRLLPLPNPAVVLPVTVADRARTGGAPLDDYASQGVVAVDGQPPTVGVRISSGTRGRLLVVAAEEEPGWVATVNGQRVDVTRAWGHLVSVVLPAEPAEVRLERSTAVRALLLLAQLAVALFTVVTAVPPARE